MGAFVRYAVAVSRRETEERVFRVYVTESLRLQGQGKCISTPWLDIIEPKPAPDAGKIIDDVVTRAGLVMTHEPA